MSLIVFFLVLYLSPGSVIIASGQGQTTGLQVLERSDDWQCASLEERERARNKIHQITESVITTTFTQPTTTIASTTTTVASTMTMPSTITSATTVSTMTDCSGPGWRHVAFINMTDTTYNCPTGLNLTSYSKRTCGRSHTTRGGRSSTTFSVGGLPYSRVCGRIRGYQFGVTSAFYAYIHMSRGINDYYVDGVSLTHGVAGNRQHIWTFAAGLTEANIDSGHDCPCDASRFDHVPTFIGNDYFCESGLHSEWRYPDTIVFYPDDVLWDGQNCTSTSTCCQFNNPPWFTKNLPTATSDDIELRICTNFEPTNDDVPIELIELYVQ